MSLINKLAVVIMLLFPMLLSAETVVIDTLGGAKSIATSPAELLKGKVSGVRVSALDGSPNGHLNMNIRGVNTLRGDSQPLYIVDGAVIGSSVNHNLNAFYLSGGTTINGDLLPDYSGKYYTSPLGNFNWLNSYEIESVDVLKDISSTSRYGMQGANGVVIIKTRKPHTGSRNIWVHSNVGVEFPNHDGIAFGNGMITSHNVGVNGIFGRNSYYNISGFLRYDDSPVVNSSSMTGGLAVNIEMTASELFEFGFHSFLNYGDYVSVTGTNYIGAPSLMTLSRYPEAFGEGDTLLGWIDSYDDETIDYRTVNSVWLKINFLRYLNLRLAGGMDYQNQTRFLWFGTGTSFGKDFSGATSIINNSLMNYNFTGELNYDRSFAVKHHLKLVLAYDLNGNINKTNSMCGTDFRNPALRGKGLNGSGSLHAIRKFNRNYSRKGGYAYAGYDFDGYAGISASVKCESTSRLDHEPMWLPSSEAFVNLGRLFSHNNKAISGLKITGGYGWAGHETVLPYEYLSAYLSDVPSVALGTEPYFDGSCRLLSKEWNVGLSAGFLTDRIALSFKYYDKKTEDAFWLLNYGKMMSGLWVDSKDWTIDYERVSYISNNGFEIDADFRLIQSRNVDWTLRANTSYNINSVLALDVADEKVQDNVLPKLHGGFGTVFSLYGFTLDASFSGVAGFDIINANKLLETGRTEILPEDYERGDYLRFDCLTFAYDIPVRLRWMKGIKVSMSGQNLFTATEYSGWNPDVNSFGVTTRNYGIDYGAFPIFRTIILGLSLKF